MNKNLLYEKIDTILRCVDRVHSKKPVTLDLLIKDIDSQDIISLNLERAVQASVDIAAHLIAYTNLPAAPTMALSFDALQNANWIDASLADRMRKAVGLRNILVHQYQAVDWNIIWSVLQKNLGDFHDFCKAIQSNIK